MRFWLKCKWVQLVQCGIDFCEIRMQKAQETENIDREILWNKIGYWLIELP